MPEFYFLFSLLLLVSSFGWSFSNTEYLVFFLPECVGCPYIFALVHWCTCVLRSCNCACWYACTRSTYPFNVCLVRKYVTYESIWLNIWVHGQILPEYRIFGKAGFCPLNQRHSGNRMKSLPFIIYLSYYFSR
jgi:hypothetical protein